MKRKNLLLQLLIVLVLLSFSAVTATGQAEMCGDMNDDGTTDIVDALLIAQCYAGIPSTCPDATAGDVNCDEQIDIVDALLVAQFYVGLNAALNCCDTSETPVPGLADCSEAFEWDAGTTYDTPGTQVQYNGNLYENNWYTSDQNPEEYSGEYDVWTLIEQCDPEPGIC